MRSASVASEPAWQVNERGPHALEVVLHKATYVLPWTQFLFAEGARMRSVGFRHSRRHSQGKRPGSVVDGCRRTPTGCTS
jgi:hypothetical protein